MLDHSLQLLLCLMSASTLNIGEVLFLFRIEHYTYPFTIFTLNWINTLHLSHTVEGLSEFIILFYVNAWIYCKAFFITAYFNFDTLRCIYIFVLEVAVQLASSLKGKGFNVGELAKIEVCCLLLLRHCIECFYTINQFVLGF